MTISVSDNTPRVSYSVSAGATQTSFTVSFEFFADADLNVYVDGTKKTLTTHYSVTGGDGSTGSISMSVTGASGGSTVVITRGIALERTTDFPVSGAFAVGTLNTELDRFVAIQADLNDTITRSIRLADDDTAVTMELPDKADRLGKGLSFHSSTGAVQVQTYATPDATAGIDGVTAGTVAASKFLQVDANRDLSTIRNLTSDGTITASSFVIGSAAINENDLEALDDVTAGTVAASKAAIVDTNKDITGFRNITLTGELDAATLDISGNADIDGTLEADAITVDGTALATYIRDTVGTNMLSSNDESGITVIYDTTNDNIDFAVDAAQTGITSLLATDIKIGEDDQTKIDFETADEIHFYANNVSLISLTNANSGDAVLTVPTADKNFTIKGTDGSSSVTPLDIDMADAGKATFGGNVVVTGDLTISGDDLFMNTNTSGYMLVADGTNYNPVAISGDVTMAASGAVTIANDAVEQAMIADDAVGSDQIADNAVVTASIADDAISQAKIADDAVGADQLRVNSVVNASIQSGAAIADTKLATISSANKVSVAAVNIDGGTDIGEVLADSDTLLVYNASGGVNRKVESSRIKTFINNQLLGTANHSDMGVSLEGLERGSYQPTMARQNGTSTVMAGNPIGFYYGLVTLPADDIRCVLFYSGGETSSGITYDSIGFNVNTANSSSHTIQIGIFTRNKYGFPSQRLHNASFTNPGASTGAKTDTTEFTLKPGWYYACIHCSSSSLVISQTYDHQSGGSYMKDFYGGYGSVYDTSDSCIGKNSFTYSDDLSGETAWAVYNNAPLIKMTIKTSYTGSETGN